MSDEQSEHITLPHVLCYGTAEVINRIQLPFMPTPVRDSLVTSDYYRVGGTALNVALPLAVWGANSVVVGNELGEDAYADLVLSELERHPSVQAQWLVRTEQARTPFTRIFVLPDRERYAVRYWQDQTRWAEITPSMLTAVGYLSLDETAGDKAVQAAALAQVQGITVVSSDIVEATHPLARHSDIVITSATTLRRCFTTFEQVDIASSLIAAGVRIFIVTNGSKPVQVFTADGDEQTYPSFPLPPADRTGAGDVFKAGCLFGLVQGWELPRYIRFATAAASLWIAQPTPFKQASSLDDILALQSDRAVFLQTKSGEADDRQIACPLCQRLMSKVIFDKHWRMERMVVAALRRSYPGWRRADGACPQCIHQHRAIVARNQQPGRALLLPDHPIYGKPDLFVLPTPVRLRANPHYTGQGITIAFLDSGFYPHPDLIQPHNRIVEMVDASSDEIIVGADFREPAAVSWHGMMTSVAAAGNGALSAGRYAGIASKAQVVLIKISDPQGRVRERDIARGLRWLLRHHKRYGIQIVNISVGGDRSGLNRNSAVDTLVRQLVSRGLVVVAAAGNAGESDLFPPASAAQAITVGGIDDSNVLDLAQRRMYGSNWGRTESGMLKPEVVAPSIWLAAPVLPGTHIAEQNLLLDRLWQAQEEELATLLVSTYRVLDFPAAILRDSPAAQRAQILQKLVENKFVTPYYQHVDGTSFASPIVSSVVAQMLEANPRLSPADIKSLIVATAERLPNEPEERQGYGLIAPGRAVAAALRLRHGALDEAPLSPVS